MVGVGSQLAGPISLGDADNRRPRLRDRDHPRGVGLGVSSCPDSRGLEVRADAQLARPPGASVRRHRSPIVAALCVRDRSGRRLRPSQRVADVAEPRRGDGDGGVLRRRYRQLHPARDAARHHQSVRPRRPGAAGVDDRADGRRDRRLSRAVRRFRRRAVLGVQDSCGLPPCAASAAAISART